VFFGRDEAMAYQDTMRAHSPLLSTNEEVEEVHQRLVRCGLDDWLREVGAGTPA